MLVCGRGTTGTVVPFGFVRLEPLHLYDIALACRIEHEIDSLFWKLRRRMDIWVLSDGGC